MSGLETYAKWLCNGGHAMNQTIESLKSRLRSVERDLEARLIKSRRQFEYSLVNGKAVFTRAARKRHAELKKSLVATLADARSGR